MAAVWHTDPEVIKALLAAGADVNARDGRGATSLHWAAAENDIPKVLTSLLAGGADTKAKTVEGWTAWDLVQENPNLKGTEAYRLLGDVSGLAPDEVRWAEVSDCTDLLKVKHFLAEFPESRHMETAQACEAGLELEGGREAERNAVDECEDDPLMEVEVSFCLTR